MASPTQAKLEDKSQESPGAASDEFHSADEEENEAERGRLTSTEKMEKPIDPEAPKGDDNADVQQSAGESKTEGVDADEKREEQQPSTTEDVAAEALSKEQQAETSTTDTACTGGEAENEIDSMPPVSAPLSVEVSSGATADEIGEVSVVVAPTDDHSPTSHLQSSIDNSASVPANLQEMSAPTETVKQRSASALGARTPSSLTVSPGGGGSSKSLQNSPRPPASVALPPTEFQMASSADPDDPRLKRKESRGDDVVQLQTSAVDDDDSGEEDGHENDEEDVHEGEEVQAEKQEEEEDDVERWQHRRRRRRDDEDDGDTNDDTDRRRRTTADDEDEYHEEIYGADGMLLDRRRPPADGQEAGAEDGEEGNSEGDEAEAVEGKPDEDNDTCSPAYVPRRGGFYQHDSRLGDENAVDENADEKARLENDAHRRAGRADKDRWTHDRYREEDQMPRSVPAGGQHGFGGRGSGEDESDRRPRGVPRRRPRGGRQSGRGFFSGQQRRSEEAENDDGQRRGGFGGGFGRRGGFSTATSSAYEHNRGKGYAEDAGDEQRMPRHPRQQPVSGFASHRQNPRDREEPNYNQRPADAWQQSPAVQSQRSRGGFGNSGDNFANRQQRAVVDDDRTDAERGGNAYYRSREFTNSSRSGFRGRGRGGGVARGGSRQPPAGGGGGFRTSSNDAEPYEPPPRFQHRRTPPGSDGRRAVPASTQKVGGDMNGGGEQSVDMQQRPAKRYSAQRQTAAAAAVTGGGDGGHAMSGRGLGQRILVPFPAASPATSFAPPYYEHPAVAPPSNTMPVGPPMPMPATAPPFVVRPTAPPPSVAPPTNYEVYYPPPTMLHQPPPPQFQAPLPPLGGGDETMRADAEPGSQPSSGGTRLQQPTGPVYFDPDSQQANRAPPPQARPKKGIPIVAPEGHESSS